MSASSMVKRAINGSLLACLLIAAPGHAQKTEPVWGYKVRPGDRLIDIAKSYQKNPDDWKKLQQSNTVPDPKLLQPGKQINIPVADLKQGDPFAAAVLVHGEVQRLDKSGQPVAKVVSGDVLKMGDTIQTGARSTLTVRFADDSRMLVTEKAKSPCLAWSTSARPAWQTPRFRCIRVAPTRRYRHKRGRLRAIKSAPPRLTLPCAERVFAYRLMREMGQPAPRSSKGWLPVNPKEVRP